MTWLVDTDVLSEPSKPHPDAAVLDWLRRNACNIYTSTHCIGEIAFGIRLKTPGAARNRLQAWLNLLVDRMGGRILSFNTSVALVWADQEAERHRLGQKIPLLDSMIAATAMRYGHTIVTRNTAHYLRPGLRVFNPFDSSSSINR